MIYVVLVIITILLAILVSTVRYLTRQFVAWANEDIKYKRSDLNRSK